DAAELLRHAPDRDQALAHAHDLANPSAVRPERPRRRIHSENTTMTIEATRMRLPSARTPGSNWGKRSWLKMKTGNVTGAPHRKAATRYSSKEALKQSSRLDTIPGQASGNVIRQKVCQGLSPRSDPASSRLRSKPSSREIMMSIE